MESLPDVAHRVLTRHPAPALPFHELHRQVTLAKAGPTPKPDFLLSRLRSRRGRFRILDPWRGPWRTLLDRPPCPASSASAAASCLRSLRERGIAFDPWIVARTPDPGSAPPRRANAALRLRSSLLHLSRTIDGDSASTLARWMLLLREERALRRRIVRST